VRGAAGGTEVLKRGPLAGLVLALAVVAVVALALVALVTGGNGQGSEAAATGAEAPIAATGSITPRIALFGDTVIARVDVTIDRAQLDPSLVRVKAGFGTWSRVGQPVGERKDSGDTTYLRTTYLLRCLIALCVPSNGTGRYEFNPAKVSYEAPKGDAVERLVIDAHWPVLVVHSRLDASDLTERDPLAAPWRADLVSLPSVTYRIRPGLLTVLLLAGGISLLTAAGALLYRILPRRSAVAPPLPPPPPPRPVLSPLEQALVLLESQDSEDGVAERRRALELVADELAVRDDRALERTARTLAWSEEEPDAEATRTLAATVRAYLVGRENGGPA
jgi:hypothetical protein